MNIIGRLTRDAEVHTLKDDRKVVNFAVAVNDSYKNKQGERVTLTEYFDCSYWIGTGVATALTKGTLVELAGRVSARAWLTQDGEAKAALNFHTSEIRLHGGGKKDEPAEAPRRGKKAKGKQATADSNGDDDLPF